jgi:multidrug efflux pump subunit AcrA (membrane-fusion protein)
MSMSRPRNIRRLVSGLALLASGLVLFGCQEVPSTKVDSEPFTLEPIEGTDVQRVLLAAHVARKIDIQTAEVRARGKQRVVPHAAVIYNPEGKSFVYTVPKPLTYVRAPVAVRLAVDERAILTEGPPAGTKVVTVGAAELLATEYEILNQHP